LVDLLYIGANIRKIRKELKIPINTIATKIGVSRKTIHSIEYKGSFGKSFTKYMLFLKKKGIDLNIIYEREKEHS